MHFCYLFKNLLSLKFLRVLLLLFSNSPWWYIFSSVSLWLFTSLLCLLVSIEKLAKCAWFTQFRNSKNVKKFILNWRDLLFWIYTQPTIYIFVKVGPGPRWKNLQGRVCCMQDSHWKGIICLFRIRKLAWKWRFLISMQNLSLSLSLSSLRVEDWWNVVCGRGELSEITTEEPLKYNSTINSLDRCWPSRWIWMKVASFDRSEIFSKQSARPPSCESPLELPTAPFSQIYFDGQYL